MPSRVAIVTGGTRGIGRAISLRLAHGGTIPFMIYHNDRESAEETLRQVQKLQPDARIAQADIAESDQVAAAIGEALAKLGRIDALINNAFASTGSACKLHEIELDAWESGLRKNLTGPFLVTKACLPTMLDQKRGRIVFIGSLALRGEPGRAIYVASKSGQLGLMKTIAKEYARHGITANMVSPGYINAGGFLPLDQVVKDRAAKSVPCKRLGSAEEVAEAVFYFASEDSGYTTGQLLGVDGAAP